MLVSLVTVTRTAISALDVEVRKECDVRDAFRIIEDILHGTRFCESLLHPLEFPAKTNITTMSVGDL